MGSSPPAARWASAASAAPSRSPLRQRASARSASASRSSVPAPAICSSSARARVSSPPRRCSRDRRASAVRGRGASGADGRDRGLRRTGSGGRQPLHRLAGSRGRQSVCRRVTVARRRRHRLAVVGIARPRQRIGPSAHRDRPAAAGTVRAPPHGSRSARSRARVPARGEMTASDSSSSRMSRCARSWTWSGGDRLERLQRLVQGQDPVVERLL